MDESAFWELIDKAGLNAHNDTSAFSSYLEIELFKMAETGILAFAGILQRKLSAANTPELWGAACIINSGCSGSSSSCSYPVDDFECFRGWLIARGKTVYEAALQDADSLAEYMKPQEDFLEYESILYVAHYVYEMKTGREVPGAAVEEPMLPWKEWQPGELPAKYPRLAKKYNPLQFDSF